MMDQIDYLSFKHILQERCQFRQAGGPKSTDFNQYDMPGAQFFRVLFHFYGAADPSTGQKNPSGLLHPTWMAGGILAERDQVTEALNLWDYNTAWSYLLMNDEQERANYLMQFINLLSNINSESPWYFQSVSGIDEAIKRSQLTDAFDFKERKKITLECLPDSVDQRIGTLMDLYRAATYSWINKKEIVPANLRKFDMSIIVFQMPIQRMHTPAPSLIKLPDVLGMTSALLGDGAGGYATLNASSSDIIASYKIYEFHGCEFDYNSPTDAGSGISNAEFFQTSYKIGITYNDMYEIRHNEFMQPFTVNYSGHAATRTFSYQGSDYGDDYDAISAIQKSEGYDDSLYSASETKTEASDIQISEITDLVLVDTAAWNEWSGDIEPIGQPAFSDHQNVNGKSPLQSNLLTQAVGQVSSLISNKIDQKINKIFLGNLFKFSLKDITNTANSFLSGNFLGGINQTKSVIKSNYNGTRKGSKPPKSIIKDSEAFMIDPDIMELGNLFQTVSLLSNI